MVRTVTWFETSSFLLLHTGFLVDVSHEYKYLFLMCGSVITTGGFFLFIMNIYNYHMLKKEKTAKDREQNRGATEDQVEMKRTPEAEIEPAEPEAENGAQRGPCPEDAENPN